MKKTEPVALWVGGFLLLSLYVNILPRLFDAGQVTIWFAYWAGFFLLAFLVSRYMLRLPGLRSLGMERHRGWLLNLGLGFTIGLSLYALKYLVFYAFGKFEVMGVRDAGFILPLLAQALLAMFFSSILNDISIRGYWYAFFRRRHLLAWYVFTATTLYALDDFWNEGIDLLNLAFSVILGLAFSYTVLKTGSIWLSLGLHWGVNMMYRVMYGFTGEGVLELGNVLEAPLFDYLNLFITFLMLPAVYFIVKAKRLKSKEALDEEGQRAV